MGGLELEGVETGGVVTGLFGVLVDAPEFGAGLAPFVSGLGLLGVELDGAGLLEVELDGVGLLEVELLGAELDGAGLLGVELLGVVLVPALPPPDPSGDFTAPVLVGLT